MGRPAINTALNHVLDAACTASTCAAKDKYNADGKSSGWTAAYEGEFAKNLGILDGVDTVCGNQAGYGGPLGTAYTTLATVLTVDALWLNTGSSTCALYLGVELNALGATNTDCGGRHPSENTIDETLNLAALGAPTGPATNGIKKCTSCVGKTFPYLPAPH